MKPSPKRVCIKCGHMFRPWDMSGRLCFNCNKPVRYEEVLFVVEVNGLGTVCQPVPFLRAEDITKYIERKYNLSCSIVRYEGELKFARFPRKEG